MSEKALLLLVKLKSLVGLSDVELMICTHCLNQSKMGTFNPRKAGSLELIHFDVCTLMKIKSFGSSCYFVNLH